MTTKALPNNQTLCKRLEALLPAFEELTKLGSKYKDGNPNYLAKRMNLLKAYGETQLILQTLADREGVDLLTASEQTGFGETFLPPAEAPNPKLPKVKTNSKSLVKKKASTPKTKQKAQ